MQCSKCNHLINEGQEVCLNCGHILGYESEESKNCLHCAREIPIAYKKCPYCHKKQRSKRIFFLILIIIFITNTFSLSIIYSSSNLDKKNNYVKECIQVSYENLVRKSIYYEGSLIKISGKIISVESLSNITRKIKVKIYVNNDSDYIIEGNFYNKDLIGFIKNDEVTIYGKYKKLKGNIPIINIKYIDMIKNTK